MREIMFAKPRFNAIVFFQSVLLATWRDSNIFGKGKMRRGSGELRVVEGKISFAEEEHEK